MLTLSDLPAGASRISGEQMLSLMQTHPNELTIVDVRDPDEFITGHIPDAYLLPLGAILVGDLAGLPEDKSTPLFVYCHSGQRSETAAQVLVAFGYEKVINFGGVLDWPSTLVR